jgi:hypothetical protein
MTLTYVDALGGDVRDGVDAARRDDVRCGAP